MSITFDRACVKSQARVGNMVYTSIYRVRDVRLSFRASLQGDSLIAF